MPIKLCRCFGKKISANLGAVSVRPAPPEGKFFTEVRQLYFIQHYHKIAAAIGQLFDRNEKISVNDTSVSYLRVGTGEHPVLLLPGVGGSIWWNFQPQVEGLDRKRLIIVAWDSPGCGKSRPPDRTLPDDYFERDAEQACNLMKVLGCPRVSLIGWCDGGISSLKDGRRPLRAPT